MRLQKSGREPRRLDSPSLVPRNRNVRVAVLGSSVQRAAASGHSSTRSSPLRRRFVVVGLVVLSLALLTVSFRSTALDPVESASASALRPFEIAANRVAHPFRDAANWTHGLFNAKAENKKLRAENARLRRNNAALTGRGCGERRAPQAPALRPGAELPEGLRRGRRARADEPVGARPERHDLGRERDGISSRTSWSRTRASSARSRRCSRRVARDADHRPDSAVGRSTRRTWRRSASSTTAPAPRLVLDRVGKDKRR